MARPVHQIKWVKRIVVAFTYCGVDPYRRGVEVVGKNNSGPVTCKDCLAVMAEESRAALAKAK